MGLTCLGVSESIISHTRWGCEGSSHPGLVLPPIAPPIPQFEMLNAELEENQELANSRMAELEKLQAELQGAVRTNERLKVSFL